MIVDIKNPFDALKDNIIFLIEAESEYQNAKSKLELHINKVTKDLEKDLLDLVPKDHESLKILKIITSKEKATSAQHLHKETPVSLLRELLMGCFNVEEKHFACEFVINRLIELFPVSIKPERIYFYFEDLNKNFWKEQARIEFSYNESFYSFRFNKLA